MIDLPAPLVPPEVDLRDFGFMPLDVVRLRDSDMAVLATGDEFKAAVLLWATCWHQVPAGSLPNDDRLLAHYSAAGDRWRKVKVGALRGFVECCDGRLYHPVIAEKALESWRAKQAQRERTKAATEAREAKRRQQQAQRDERPDEPLNVQRRDQRDVARDVVQGTGTGTVKGQGHLIPPPDGGVGGAAPSASPPPPPPAPDFDGKNTLVLNGKSVVALSLGFELPEQWGIDAEALGWKPQQVLLQAERFRQYWTAGKGAGTRRSVKGWRQAWSNWLERAARDSR